MILDCHVHLPSPGLNRTLEWEPCTPDLGPPWLICGDVASMGIVASSMRALLAQLPEEVRAGNDEMAQAASHILVLSSRLPGEYQFPGGCISRNSTAAKALGMVWVGELCGYIGGYSYDTTAFGEAIHSATELDMVVQIHDDSASDMARLCAQFPQNDFCACPSGRCPGRS